MSSEARQFIDVGSESEVPVGKVIVVHAGKYSIALANDEGQLCAIDNRCTHDNGPLGEGELVDGEIECPRHGARFDCKTGKAMCLPAVGKVATYPVEVRDGRIFIGIPSS